MWRIIAAFIVMTGPASAQDWAVRDGDNVLSPQQMQEQVIGQELTFYDNGVSRYTADGAYSYTYDGGGTAFGTYTMPGDGVFCTVFQNGFERCDMIVRSGARLVVITQKGDRFPVRP